MRNFCLKVFGDIGLLKIVFMFCLDPTFSEDKSRIRKDNSPENFALLRKLALNLLNQEKSTKASNKMKRYRAAMDNNYLLKILQASGSKSDL